MTTLTTDNQQNIQIIKHLSKLIYANQPFLEQLSVAQAILESNLQGEKPSELAYRYNNLYGMKPGWIRTGTHIPGSVQLPTEEYVQNQGMVKMNQPFLWNNTVEDSIKQHKELLSTLSRYENLKTATSFKEIATLIQEDGYATDPSYTTLLIEIYQKYQLGSV